MSLPIELQVARVLLCKGRPYLATAAWALQPVAVRDHPLIRGTVACDRRWRLYYDPEVLPTWTPEQLAGALYHELHHLLRRHFARADTKGVHEAGGGMLANLAQDCEINDDLERERVKLPPVDYCTPSKFGLTDSDLWENYYDELAKRAQPITLVATCGAGGCGSCAGGIAQPYELPGGAKQAPGVTEAQGDLIIRKTAADVLEHAKTRGDVPASLKRWAEAIANPQVPWQRVLAAEIRRSTSVAQGAVDYSHRRPNRRNTGPFILPSMVRPVPNIAVVGDTSGSMGERELSALVMAELKGISRALGRGTLTFLDVDAEVHGVQRVTSERQVKLRGGGGTDMRVGIDRACEIRPRPSLIVVLTDGETGWGDAPAAVPVLAVVPTGAPDTPGWMKRVEVQL